MKIYIDTNTFPASPALYADAAKTKLLPRVIPLVQGFRGTLELCFLGELAPAVGNGITLAMRPYGAATDVVRTGTVAVEAGTESGVPAVAAVSLAVDTTQLQGALFGKESLNLLCGVIATDDAAAFPTRVEWQLVFSVSASALGGGVAPDISPTAVEQLNAALDALSEKVSGAEENIGLNADAIATKANDADVVHKSGIETIVGLKRFSTGSTSENTGGGVVVGRYASDASEAIWNLNGTGLNVEAYKSSSGILSYVKPLEVGSQNFVGRYLSGSFIRSLSTLASGELGGLISIPYIPADTAVGAETLALKSDIPDVSGIAANAAEIGSLQTGLTNVNFALNGKAGKDELQDGSLTLFPKELKIESDGNVLLLSGNYGTALSISDSISGTLVLSGLAETHFGGGNLTPSNVRYALTDYDLYSAKFFKVGDGAEVKGESIALGVAAKALDDYSAIALGAGAFASGYYAVALGAYAMADSTNGSSQSNPIALGLGAYAKGYGVALGKNSVAFGNGVALGGSATAYGDSLAFGRNSVAYHGATALGYGAVAGSESLGQSGDAIGCWAASTANYATAIGRKAVAAIEGSTVISAYNDSQARGYQMVLVPASYGEASYLIFADRNMNGTFSGVKIPSANFHALLLANGGEQYNADASGQTCGANCSCC